MKHRPFVAALTGAALLVGLAGCSSSGSSGGDASTTTTTTAPAASSTEAPATTAKSGTTSTSRKAGTGTAEDPSPEKAAFLEKGNALCAQMNEDVAAAQAKLPGGKPTTVDELAAFLQTNIDIIGSTLVELRGLTPPSGDEAQVDELLTAAEAMLPLAEQARQAAVAGDQAAFEAAGARMDAQTKKANQLADAYGLTECAKGSK